MIVEAGDVVVTEANGLCGVVRVKRDGTLLLAPLEGQEPPPALPRSAVRWVVARPRRLPGHAWIMDRLARARR